MLAVTRSQDCLLEAPLRCVKAMPAAGLGELGGSVVLKRTSPLGQLERLLERSVELHAAQPRAHARL